MHRFRTARLTSFLAVALLGVGAVAHLEPVAANADPRPTYQLVVTSRPPEGGADFAIEDAFIAQLAATPAGARVRMAQTNIARMPVAEAIVAAHQRGVDIELVLNGKPAPSRRPS